MKWLLPLPKLPCRKAALLVRRDDGAADDRQGGIEASFELGRQDVITQRGFGVVDALGELEDVLVLVDAVGDVDQVLDERHKVSLPRDRSAGLTQNRNGDEKDWAVA